MFAPGDEVVCVEGAEGYYPETGHIALVQGAVYTIKAFYPEGSIGVTGRVVSMDTVSLHEFSCQRSGRRHGFAARRFRKVQRRTDSLAIESFLTIKPGQFEEPKRAPARKRERA